MGKREDGRGACAAVSAYGARSKNFLTVSCVHAVIPYASVSNSKGSADLRQSRGLNETEIP
jgi:hypothetical protein